MNRSNYLLGLLFLGLLAAPAHSLVLITAGGLNHTENKAILAQFPEKYLEHVNVIEFVPERTLLFKDYEARGLVRAWWYIDNHECYDVRITIAYSDRGQAYIDLWHELGHVYEFCHKKQDTSSEEYANGFYNQELCRDRPWFC